MKILIGCPTYNKQAYCLDRFLEALQHIDFPNYDILLVDNTEESNEYYEHIKNKGIAVIKDNTKGSARQKLESSRNILRQKALEGNYEYLLTLDQDIIVPKDILQKLLENKKDFVTGIYFTHMEKQGIIKTIPVIFIDTKIPRQVTHLSIEQAFKDQLIQIRSCGLGCTLVSKKLLEKLDFSIDKNFKGGEDTYFCLQVQKKGFEIYCDTRVKCKHLITEQKEKWKDIEF